MNALLRAADISTSTLASTLRGWRGSMQRHSPPDPMPQLELYEFEACPFCRFVREAITELQLDVLVYPCPRSGVHRAKARKHAGGKTTFPFLVDHTADVAMAESRDIVAHLYETYAGAQPPFRSPLALPTASLASALRLYRGAVARDSKIPELPLKLWSFESSPFCRIVRERLCELQLPYELVSMAKEQFSDIGLASSKARSDSYEPVPGGRREALIERGGRSQVPYLEDPNTGVGMYESADIVDYLEKTYARS